MLRTYYIGGQSGLNGTKIMADALDITPSNFCYSCMSKKHVQVYRVQSELLQNIFKLKQLTLCYVCIRVAQRAEKFIQNVQANQNTLKQCKHIDDVDKQDIKFHFQPIVNLTQCVQNETDVINICDKDPGDVITSTIEIKVEPIEEPLPEFEEASVKLEANLQEDKDVQEKEEEKKIRKFLSLQVVRINLTKEQCMEEREKAALEQRYQQAIFKCSDCVRWYTMKMSLDKHMELHHESNGQYECEICKQRMPTSTQLLKHRARHLLRYRCTECTFTRTQRNPVKDHYALAHRGDAQDCSCTFCGHKLRTKHALRKHMQAKHYQTGKDKLKCDYCEKTFSFWDRLKTHLKFCHTEEVSASIKTFECQVCGKSFKNSMVYKNHVDSHGEKREHYCEECDKSFKTKAALSAHFRNVSAHAKEAILPFPCPQCEKRFRRVVDLERHGLVHLNKQDYKCEQCNKDFVSQGKLNSHVRLVHKQYKPPGLWPCTFCDQSFSENHELESHVKIHSDAEKQFKCTRCPAEFAHRVSLYNHTKRAHSGTSQGMENEMMETESDDEMSE